jgi:hypothetical protein
MIMKGTGLVQRSSDGGWKALPLHQIMQPAELPIPLILNKWTAHTRVWIYHGDVKLELSWRKIINYCSLN